MPFTSVNDNIYSHAYLNVYASGSISFSKVEFIGGGFEFDNVAVSNQLSTPSSELVLLQSVLGKSVEFRANGGTGTMPAQTSDAATQLSSNAFTRTGYTFNGWHTTSSGTGGTPFSDQASFDFANDMVLHAQWTPLPASTSTTTSSTSTSSTSTSSTTTTVLEPVIAEQQSKDLPVTGTNPWPVASLALLALSFGFVVLHRQRRY